jgi:probable phosphoglycerate mutase
MPREAPRPRVLLVRHGETAWNAVERIQGHEDVPLSARGREQAAALAARLAREGVARVVSSDLARARETAEVVAAAARAPLVLDPRLREQRMGAWQGITFEEAKRRDADLAARFAARDPDVRPPGGGESRVELSARVWEALDAHAKAGTASPLVVVAHGGPLQVVIYRVLGLDLRAPRRFALPNAGITSLLERDGAWHVTSHADVAHLPAPSVPSFPFE